MSTLSVVVVNHNTRDLLRDCLGSVVADGAGIPMQIVVVDNGSSDNSGAMVRAEFPASILIENISNHGFSKANNQGLKASNSDFVLFLNSDSRLQKGALKALIDFIQSSPNVGIVGPRVLNGDGSLQLSCGISPTVWTEVCNKLLLHIPFPFFKMGSWAHDETREVGWVSGACMFVRREMLEQIGYLDEGMFMYYEDLDICFRARRSGWKVSYVPGGQVIHLGGRTSQVKFGPMLIASVRSSFYFFRKHYGEGAVSLLRLVTLPEMALRSSIWGALAMISPRRRKEAFERLRSYRTILLRTLRDRNYWRPASEP